MDNELNLSDYLSILKRRWRQILTTFLVLMTIITAVVYTLPPVYKSEGHISIESSALPDDVVKLNRVQHYVDESIDKVKQKVFSKENLLNLNEKYDLFPVQEDIDNTLGPIINSIIVNSETRDSSSNQWDSQKITVGLIVGFKYSKPDVSYKVANEIIRQLLDENIKARTARATETATFLTDEANRLKKELEQVENKVADYKQKHANSLPEHQEMHMTSLEQLRTALKDLDREYKTTQEELRYLDVELTTTEASVRKGDTSLVTPGGISELDKARAELDRSLVVYKETHPTVRALKRKIALLEQREEAPKEVQPKKSNAKAELALAKIRTKIDAANARLDSITNQKRSMNVQMQTLQRQIMHIPQVESGLATLLRDYENAKLKYEEVKAKQLNAQIAENLERGEKADRFILKESPEYPKYKDSPKRKQLMAMGMLASLILGVALAILLEMLDGRVRGQGALVSVIDMKPLAVIPYIQTQAEVNKTRNATRYVMASLLALLILGAILAAVHFYVMPLDKLIKLS